MNGGELALWEWLRLHNAENLYGKLLWLNFEEQNVEQSLTMLRALSNWSYGEEGYSLHHMMESKNWRHHLLAIGAILSTSEHTHQNAIESRIRKGSMVAPQLIAALGLLHQEEALSFLQMYAQNDEPLEASYSEAARHVLFWMKQSFVEQTCERPELMPQPQPGESFCDYLEKTLQHYGQHPFGRVGLALIRDLEDRRRLGRNVATTYIHFWNTRLS